MPRLRLTFAICLLLGLMPAFLAGCPTRSEYSWSAVPVGNTTEYHLSRTTGGETQHFLTLIEENGVVAIRPHPGVDPNGWGSSWYPQPFLAGAVLGHSGVDDWKVRRDGIRVWLSGRVSNNASDTFGTWASILTFRYDPETKTVLGNGSYTGMLDAALASEGKDLSLGKVASNYLDDVPLLGGGTGDTGDMAYADVFVDTFTFTWIPPDQPAHYPTDTGQTLTVDTAGQHNIVDTAAQGHAPIAAAWKPSLKVTLESLNGAEVAFGGQYRTDAAQDFWEDNVGITPLLLKASPYTQLVFDAAFESKALAGDGS